ncbi:MAG: hypothetical protein AAFR32_10695 [Pseudomonadota bacterium]
MENPTCVKCSLTEEHADDLHDRLIDLLDSAGFGPDWEPTSVGLRIEKLIDLVHDASEDE